MNKNSKRNFNEAKRNAAKGNKSSEFVIPRVLDGVGEGTSWGAYGPKVINFISMPRKRKFAKVARRGIKTRREIEQDEILDIEAQELQSIKLAQIAQLSPKELIIQAEKEVIAPIIEPIAKETIKQSIVEKVV